MKARVPTEETARLQALRDYAILDTLEESAFNDITMLASLICDTPIALISLVDSERQWFKARVGMTVTQAPREHAFCAHAILRSQEILVVNDATSDQRFFDNPFVTGEPHIRFYAGAPLVTPSGDALGTLCVVDSRRRELTAKNLAALRALSQQVIALLELRRVVAELARNETQMQAFQRELEDYQRQIERANAALQEETISDGLTGVKNRRGFDQALRQELARALREKTPVSLLMIDIDKFKPFNDQFGHPAGDEALRQVATVVEVHARPFDVVARYGGEEFVIILPRVDAAAAVSIAERLRRAIEAAPWPNRAITVSIGASTTGREPDGTVLLDFADRALYRMKQRGGNQVAHADDFC